MNRLVLFDIDQTLISSGGAGSRALLQAVSEFLGISVEQVKTHGIRFSGKTDPQIIKEILLSCHFSEDGQQVFQKAIEEILDLYLQVLPGEVASATNYIVHDGVVEILNALQGDKRIALGLLTGNIEGGARIKLKRVQLDGFFPIGSFGSDSADRLDLPAIAHQRAQAFYKIDFNPSEIVIVGDAENDILCAKHYGAVSLAVSTGSTTKDELSQHGPDYIFSSLKQTQSILQAILSDKPVPGLCNQIGVSNF